MFFILYFIIIFQLYEKLVCLQWHTDVPKFFLKLFAPFETKHILKQQNS